MTTNDTFVTNPQNNPLQIAILGECMIELSGKPLEPLTQGFSGDTLNTAIYLNRLVGDLLVGDLPVKVNYATALGVDAFSEAMLGQWQAEGIDCKYVAQLPDKNPGLYFIQVDDTGERSFSYWRNDSAAKQYLEVPGASKILEAIPQFDLLYISGISLAILPNSSRDKLFKAIKEMRKNGGKLVFDNNFRPLLWASKDEAKAVYQTFTSECDLALLTLDDEVLLYGNVDEAEVFSRCKKLGITEVVIKRGAESCLIQRKLKNSVEEFEVAANKVEAVVDTTAAGDSFSAAYLAGRLHGYSPDVAALWGHKLAGNVIQHRGAVIAQEFMPVY